MKLLTSRASPYGRKVRACAAALGMEALIEVIDVDSADPGEALLAANPLGRIPTLITDDGFAIFDSPVICDYLNATSGLIPIIPLAGAPRWLCRRLEAMGDGLMDAAVGRRQMALHGAAETDPMVRRHLGAIARTLGRLEQERPSLHLDVGTISIACALGYLDHRFAGDDWRAGHPRLAAWHDEIGRHDCLASTAP